MGITCTPLIDIGTIVQPLLMKSVIAGGELNIEPLIDVMVQEKIQESLLASVELPSEFADLADVICLSLEMNKVRTVLAVLRGEAPPAGAGIEKTLELIVNLQMLSAISKAFETTTA